MPPITPTSMSVPTSAPIAAAPVPRRRRYVILALELILFGVMPMLLALRALGLADIDFSVPMHYSGADDDWQLVLTKMVRDTGWFLTSPFMGAPDIAHWNYHSAAQTSSLHSMIMGVMSWFINDAVRIQQTYYLLNFAFISLSAYTACRLLGLARFAAGSIAYLFAFTSFRIHMDFYAFLANYAAVPLAFVPVLWILIGKYATISDGGPRALFGSRSFWISIVFLVLVTLSDGYYAFFTLLMLAFAIVVRMGLGDHRRPVRLLAPVLFLATVITLALAMTLPLKAYQKTHVDEFFPDGVEDSALIKHDYEAEVYSSSLKLMIAPMQSHRVPMLANLGKKMVKSNDMARKFPVIVPIVSLGSICTLLLLIGLVAGPIILLRTSNGRQLQETNRSNEARIALAAGALAYFIFLCSVAGGVGSLVALIYPTIRAYDRFPLFLIFTLLIGAGALATGWVRHAVHSRLKLAYVAATVVTVIGLADQIPGGFSRSNHAVEERFVAERTLVHSIEHQLPIGTMVYQYPHSQYLSDNKYYGWGSFAHLRLYIHSEKLRWSNGASKNSAVETWHDKTASLPTPRFLDEITAAGFRAMIIDRTVIKGKEYDDLKAVLVARGLQVQEDSASELAWLRLPDPGYQVTYDARFDNIDSISIHDRAALSSVHLPRMIDGVALGAALAAAPATGSATMITRSATPGVFKNTQQADRGMGTTQIKPLTDMAGALRCAVAPGASATAVVSIDNKSSFDWQFGTGRLPFKLGAHIRAADDAVVRFDDGMRMAPGNWFVPAHGSIDVSIPFASISRAGLPDKPGMRVEFAVVQDGYAWFDQLRCQLPLP